MSPKIQQWGSVMNNLELIRQLSSSFKNTVLITQEDYKFSVEKIAGLRAENEQLAERLKEKDELIGALLAKLGIPAPKEPTQ